MSNIDVFFVTSFLCSLKFLLFQLIGHTKKCLQKNIENFLWLSFRDMTVPSKSNVLSLWPWPSTYESQTWGQFNSGIGIDGQFQFKFRNWNWNWNCLFEKIIELELNWNWIFFNWNWNWNWNFLNWNWNWNLLQKILIHK